MIEFRDGFYADVRTEDRSRTVISYQAGILEEMKSQVERRAFLRVYDGKMWYYASVTDLKHLQKTLDGLYAAAALNDQILDDPTVRRFERNRDTVMSFADCSVRDIPAKDKQALLLSYLPLLNEDKCVTMPSGSYLDRSSLFHFQSSLGADITYDYQTCGLSFSCDMAEGEKKFSGHWQKGATRFDELKGLTETIRAAMAEQTAFRCRSEAAALFCAAPCRLSRANTPWCSRPRRRAFSRMSPSAISPSPISCSPMKPCATSGSWARPWARPSCPLPSAAPCPAAAMCPMTTRAPRRARTI